MERLAFYDAIDGKISALELDNIVQPRVEALRLSMLQLRFYFEPETYRLFEEIEEDFRKIYNIVGELRLDYSRRENNIVRGNKFSFTIHDAFNANDKRITELCEKIRSDFNTSL